MKYRLLKIFLLILFCIESSTSIFAIQWEEPEIRIHLEPNGFYWEEWIRRSVSHDSIQKGIKDKNGDWVIPYDSHAIFYWTEDSYHYFSATYEVSDNIFRMALFTVDGEMLISPTKYQSLWMNGDHTFTGAARHGYENFAVNLNKIKIDNHSILKGKKPKTAVDLLTLVRNNWIDKQSKDKYSFDPFTMEVEVAINMEDYGYTTLNGQFKFLGEDPSQCLIVFDEENVFYFDILLISDKMILLDMKGKTRAWEIIE